MQGHHGKYREWLLSKVLERETDIKHRTSVFYVHAESAQYGMFRTRMGLPPSPPIWFTFRDTLSLLDRRPSSANAHAPRGNCIASAR